MTPERLAEIKSYVKRPDVEECVEEIERLTGELNVSNEAAQFYVQKAADAQILLASTRAELETAQRQFIEADSQRQGLESENTRLTAELEKYTQPDSKGWTHDMLKQYMLDTCDDRFECLPNCDSYGHEENCPNVYPVAAFHQMLGEVKKLEEELTRMRQALQQIDALTTNTAQGGFRIAGNGEYFKSSTAREIRELTVAALGTVVSKDSEKPPK